MVLGGLRQLAPPTIALSLILSCVPTESPAAFGQNKVRYEDFRWRVLVTDHADIYFYPEEEELAWRAADYAEKACRKLDQDLKHELSSRIPLVVFKSHHHFRQNNVSPGMVGESTGGFTEFFKNRVVLPYTGSEADFRHVIHHELVHAYMFDMLDAGSAANSFMARFAFNIPLWFAEGLAEYLSNQWDSEAEMMLRDAAVTGKLAPFDRSPGGYFVYKAGWSAVAYLARRHGEEVIPRILAELASTRDLVEAVETVTGEKVPDMAADWVRDVRRIHWPTYGFLEDPESFGEVLTSPEGMGGSFNHHPCLSPSGERVVFLSDREGTPDLWVIEPGAGTEPRLLARGNRGGKMESLHPMRSSVGWSADESMVALAARAGSRDALIIVSAETGRTLAEFDPGLDTLEEPDWSPVDGRFVFTGMKGDRVDLWAMDADGTNLVRLTNDLVREQRPRWSPDGKRVLFASDFGGASGLDLRVLEVETGEVRNLRVGPGDQWGADWTNGGASVVFVSDAEGTRDLTMMDLATGQTRRLTALLGGAGAPTAARAGSRVVFPAYSNGRWDVVLVENPDTLGIPEAESVTWPAIPWDGREICEAPTPSPAEAPDTPSAPEETAAADRSADAEPVAPPPAEPPARKTPFVIDYEPRFRPEWVQGMLGYSPFGTSGAFRTTITDILGDHRIQIGAQVFRAARNSNAFASYSYLGGRVHWETGLFHVKNFLLTDRSSLGQPISDSGERAYFSEQRWGVSGAVRYPFHTFRRVGFDVRVMQVNRTHFDRESVDPAAGFVETGTSGSAILLPRVSHTFDNTRWGWTGPVRGNRWTVSLQHSLTLGGESLSYGTALADFRAYSPRGGGTVAAVRGLAVTSFGEDPQEFQLGGPHTLRGHPYRELRGRTAFLASAEFRYPFVEYLRTGWPFRAVFRRIRGNLFVDVGAAFDDPDGFHPVGEAHGGHEGLADLKVGYGIGLRSRLAFIPVRLDVGWPTDFVHSGKPRWHFSMGTEW